MGGSLAHPSSSGTDGNPSLSLPMGVQASTRGTLVPDIWCKRLLAKAKVRSHHPMV